MTAGSTTQSQPRYRHALLLGCADFADPGLAPLRSPTLDVELLAEVLTRPVGSAYEVVTKVNCTSSDAQVAIEQFLGKAHPRDLYLVYFSGHGIQDDRGNLYFAFRNTDRELPSSTAVSAVWLRNQIDASRSRSTVLLLDCCYSGAYLHGMRPRATRDVNVASLVRDLPDGSGVAVLTSSSETEFSMEDASDAEEIRPSYFTEAIVTGIATGAADTDRDGLVTVDELYSYVYRRIKAGPSRQRPKRINLGEGNLVVALTGRPGPAVPQPRSGNLRGEPDDLSANRLNPAKARSRPPHVNPVHVAGVLGTVTFDGRQITISKTRHGSRRNGPVHITLEQLVDVTIKPATRLRHGYIQFVVRGHPTLPALRSGLAAGRPPFDDPFSLSIPHKANAAAADLRLRIMANAGQESDTERLAKHTQTGPRSRQETTTTPPAEGTARAAAPSVPPTTPTPDTASTTPTDTAVADHDRGRQDGARTAENLPLYALEGFISAQFHLDQWLQPWRERWRLIATGQAPPDPNLSRWLPALADLLGSTAAPTELPQARHTPSNAYQHAFATGMRVTWDRAVATGLVPATPAALTAWLREPRSAGEQPRSLSTLGELNRAVTRKRHRRIWTIIGRITLWVLVGLFTILETAAIVVTITDGWPEHNVTGAIAGNLCYGLPLLGLLTLGMIDLRRLRRRRASVKPAPATSARPPNQG